MARLGAPLCFCRWNLLHLGDKNYNKVLRHGGSDDNDVGVA